MDPRQNWSSSPKPGWTPWAGGFTRRILRLRRAALRSHLDYKRDQNINGLPLITGEYNANTMSQGPTAWSASRNQHAQRFRGAGVMQLQGHEHMPRPSAVASGSRSSVPDSPLPPN